MGIIVFLLFIQVFNVLTFLILISTLLIRLFVLKRNIKIAYSLIIITMIILSLSAQYYFLNAIANMFKCYMNDCSQNAYFKIFINWLPASFIFYISSLIILSIFGLFDYSRVQKTSERHNSPQ